MKHAPKHVDDVQRSIADRCWIARPDPRFLTPASALEDFKLDTYRMLIDDFHALSPEERQALLERMDVADRLRGLAAEDRLRGLDAEERLRGLDPEEILRRLDPEERLRGLDPEQVTAWLKRTGH